MARPRPAHLSGQAGRWAGAEKTAGLFCGPPSERSAKKRRESFLGRNPEMDVVWGSMLHRRNRRWRGADYSTIVRSEYVSAGLDRSDRSSDDALMHVADTAAPLC